MYIVWLIAWYGRWKFDENVRSIVINNTHPLMRP